MAEYMAATRTNYFHVKDVEVFKKLVSQISDSMELFTCKMTDGDVMYGFGGYGFIKGFGEDGEDVDEVYNAFKDHVVMPDEAIVIEEIGAEKLRYLTAYAVVITTEKVEFADLRDKILEYVPDGFLLTDEY